MTTITIYEGDSLNLIIAVLNTDGTVKDVTGATVTAEVRRADGTGSDIAGTTSIPDAAGGLLGVSFDPGDITGPTAAGLVGPLDYVLQCRVVLSPESQIVNETTVRVRPSHV